MYFGLFSISIRQAPLSCGLNYAHSNEVDIWLAGSQTAALRHSTMVEFLHPSASGLTETLPSASLDGA